MAALAMTAGLLLAGCRDASRQAVIGFALGTEWEPVVRTVRRELPELADRVRIRFDTLGSASPQEAEIERAEAYATMPRLIGVVGHGSSRASLLTAPIYNDSGIPHIEPNGTSRLLRRAGPWTFTLAPNDSIEGAFLARYAVHRLGARRVSVFYVNNEYGVGLADGIMAELDRLGVTVLDQVPYRHDADVPILLDASLRRGRPDLLLVAGDARQTGQLARLAQRRIRGIRVLTGDGAMVAETLAEAAGPAADSIYGAVFWLPDRPDPVSRRFVANFRSLTGRDPEPHEALGRDAVALLVQAMREVGPDRGRIRQYLSELGGRRPPFAGVTGSISFRRDRRPAVFMARVRQGRLVRADS